MPVLSAAAATAALINNLLSLDGGRAKAECCPLSMDSPTASCSAEAGAGHPDAAADDIDQLLHLVEVSDVSVSCLVTTIMRTRCFASDGASDEGPEAVVKTFHRGK